MPIRDASLWETIHPAFCRIVRWGIAAAPELAGRENRIPSCLRELLVMLPLSFLFRSAITAAELARSPPSNLEAACRSIRLHHQVIFFFGGENQLAIRFQFSRKHENFLLRPHHFPRAHRPQDLHILLQHLDGP